MNEPTSTSTTTEDAPRYRYYVLGMLTLTYLFSFMDRQIMSILMEDLRAEFALSDAQLGLLSGLAFALFYATLGIPIARLADRWNRVRIISIAVSVWSLATALSGLAVGFASLFLARVGVGIGEAGGSPPAHSLIADYFEKAQLSRALSVYSLGTTFGSVVGMVVGGFVADAYGWRAAFFVVGLPGLLLALVFRMTVREPERGRFDPDYDANAPRANVRETLRSLMSNRVYVLVTVAHAFHVVVGYSMAIWKPALLIRTFELSKGETGVWLSSMTVATALPGMLAGGFLADRLAQRDVRWMAWMPGIALLIALPANEFALASHSLTGMLILFGVGLFFATVAHAPALAVVQRVVKPTERALAAAFVFFLANMLGLGLGPVIVGALSDGFSADQGLRSIHAALMVMNGVLLLAAASFWLTARAMQSER